jgi:putative hydrolase of the HAD superfamily
MSAIEAVLWDFGGVFTASPFEATRAYSTSLGVDHAVLLECVFGVYHDDDEHAWHRLERGEASMADAMAAAKRAANAQGFELDPAAFFGSMRDDIDRTIVLDTVRDLRDRGVRHAIVTNNAREFAASWMKLVPDGLFDVIVDSSAVGIRKPNPAIYRHAPAELGVDDPSRAAFLDDYEPNVTAARQLGLHGFVVAADPRSALVALTALVDE